MSALDFAARAIGTRNRSDGKRLTTLDGLARGIAENLPLGLPAAMGTPIAESRASATTIASGTTFGFSSSTPASHFIKHYSLYSGSWEFHSTTQIKAVTGHSGNGAGDPNANPSGGIAMIRFATNADKFEVVAMNYQGFRVKVNGKYAKTGMYGVQALNGDAASTRFWLFDFTGTEFAGTGLKLVEIQVSQFELRFGGVRVPIGHTVQPWPQALPIKAALHGDSMISTVSDTGTDHRTALQGLQPHIVTQLTGIADVWANGLGGCGFIADNSGTRSDFIEQTAADFSGEKFDLVWETGGRNDTPYYGSQAAYQVIVESWIAALLADNPDTIIVLTGPITMQNAENYQASAPTAAVQNAKRLAAAAFPRNCAFIKTTGDAVLNAPWVFGTGKQGATTADGNADTVRGNDGTHPTVFGHQYLATRLVSETARVIPLLYSRIRDGVIAGVNDLDLT